MRGATLVETLIALGLVGLLTGLAVPRAVGLRDRLIVERHTARVLEAYDRARTTALQSGGPTVLVLAAESLAVLRVESADTVSVWRAPGPAEDGVGFSTTHSRVAVGPNGLTYGLANGRIELRRGQVSRSVVASRLGRLRVVRQRRRRARTAGQRAPRCRGASSGCRASC